MTLKRWKNAKLNELDVNRGMWTTKPIDPDYAMFSVCRWHIQHKMDRDWFVCRFTTNYLHPMKNEIYRPVRYTTTETANSKSLANDQLMCLLDSFQRVSNIWFYLTWEYIYILIPILHFFFSFVWCRTYLQYVRCVYVVVVIVDHNTSEIQLIGDMSNAHADHVVSTVSLCCCAHF